MNTGSGPAACGTPFVLASLRANGDLASGVTRAIGHIYGTGLGYFFYFLCFTLLSWTPVAAEESHEVSGTVRAYFMGYEGDDLIFRIENISGEAIEVKGVSFRGQILYRPLGEEFVVSPAKEGEELPEFKFRSNGDFVWSQNHMELFRLSYVAAGTQEKGYAGVYRASEEMIE